ncbi:hypothetical protein ACHAXA_005796 [Cyclostephanos tholiformis]|uniref:SET domain-containing protein n=1 Tax=Cyclostephanos tholiformis TaxID=382380 RepID=A0ABD3RPP0_9STRA
MILALAGYASRPPSGDAMGKLLELHHPSSDDDDDCDGGGGKGVAAATSYNPDDEGTKNAMELAEMAIRCGRKMAASGSALHSLLRRNDGGEYDDDDDDDDDERRQRRRLVVRFLLVYSCNAFEGGRIYLTLSRANHSCDPNAVVVVGGGGGVGDDDNDVSALRAACDIAPGDEITVSYLGRYLYAGYAIRRRLLLANKHFVCRCDRCSSDDVDDDDGVGGDIASRVPCPICHPRTGRCLDVDVMFDDDDDDDHLVVRYAVPRNGSTPEERSVYCPTCRITTSVDGGGSTRKRREGAAVKYMCLAEDKVFDRLHGNVRTKRITGNDVDDDAEAEHDIDRQFLQMATSVCGSMHWTTHFLNLSLIEDALASFHSALLTMDPDRNDASEELLAEIAEAADGIERAFKFASSLKLRADPAHWLFDYVVGLARALVGLGDVKSQKYGSRWIGRVERYAERFENDGMKKVVIALRDAWKRETDNSDAHIPPRIVDEFESKVPTKGNDVEVEDEDAKVDIKRRKIG